MIMNNTTLLYVRKRPNSILPFHRTKSPYQWSANEPGKLRDLSFNLLKNLSMCMFRFHNNPFDKKMGDILAQKSSETNHQNEHFWQSKKAYISLEFFAQFDDLGDFFEKSIFIRRILVAFDEYINNNYTIGIDFREVFLVPPGECPPAHFRPGIDVCVSTGAEYKKKTECFSYQLGKAIFDYYKPDCSSQPQAHHDLNNTILEHYSNFPNYAIDCTTPLKNYNYSKSAFTCYVHYIKQEWPIVALTNPVEVSDLRPFFQHAKESMKPELTIVLKGNQYDNEVEREVVYAKILDLVKETKCSSLLHVFLITNDNIEENLLDLTPRALEKNSQHFHTLPQNSGYYLSSTKILSATYRNKQLCSSTARLWEGAFSGTIMREQPKTPSLEPYILAHEASENVRISKTLSCGQLKSKARLAESQQESIACTQAVNQQVQESQTQAVFQELNHSVSFSTGVAVDRDFWHFTVNLQSFCRRLESFAKNNLSRISEEEELLKQTGLLTEFYQKHHSRLKFFERLATDDNFRLHFAGQLFGVAIVEPEIESGIQHQVKLPHYGVDNIEEWLVHRLLKYNIYYGDGLWDEQRDVRESYLFGKTLYQVRHEYSGYRKIERDLQGFSKLSVFSSFPQEPCVLLTEEEIASIQAEQKNEILQSVESLLKLFKPHPKLSTTEIQVLEQQFLLLIRFYFPQRLEEIARLEKFMASFKEHNEDNLKILLQVLIHQHKQGFDCFFSLLSSLEQRSLLDFFYKIHFQYAADVSSVKELLVRTASCFLRIVARIPIAKSTDSCPDFEKLCCHLLVFARKHNLFFDNITLNDFEKLWKRLQVKFQAYCGNQEEAKFLLSLLAQKLMEDQGFSKKPIVHMETFFKGLEDLLAHAMAKHVLKEQIEEVRGISFVPMDAPYAWSRNGFKVISQEMQIHSEAINPITRSYAVSNTQLLQALEQHQPGDGYLKTALFRCLGTQNLREDIAFYRKLYQGLTEHQADSGKKYIFEILCAFYVAKFTGSGYCPDVDQEKFSQEFLDFLQSHNLQQSIAAQQISSCCEEFFLQVKQTPRDEQNGMQSLWSIWRKNRVAAFAMANTPIAEIFLRKFPLKGLGHFLLMHKEILQKELGDLNPDVHIVMALLDTWSDELDIPESGKKIVLLYFKSLYQPLNMKVLLSEVNNITIFLDSLSSLMQINSQSMIFLALSHLMDKSPKADAVFALTKLLAEETAKHEGRDKLAAEFINALETNSVLYNALPQAIKLVQILLETHFTMEIQQSPRLLLGLMETLLPLGTEEAQQLFTTLTPLLGCEKGLNFLRAHPNLNAKQLKEMAQLLQKIRPQVLAIDIIDWIYSLEPTQDLKNLFNFLKEKSEEKIRCVITLSHALSQHTGRTLQDELQTIRTLPLRELKRLALLHKLKTIKAAEIVELVAAPSLQIALEEFQQKKNQENLQRYNYDPEFVKGKIARIKLKSHATDEALPLSAQEQELIWQDYQQLMSYMVKRPIKIIINGVPKEVTIHELSETEFQLLFEALQERITKGINVHHNQLLLIALSAEALYQTTHKFPRCTQILATLKSIRFPGNLIHEIKTGEGKSIVAALHAVLFCGSGRPTDIATENDQLAKDALEKFSPFYEYLGIPHGKSIITAQSAHSEYIVKGVNYGTPSSFSLFRTLMALAKKWLPKNAGLVGDEIDAALTSTVHFRLAAALDPLLNDVKSWEMVYQRVLEFVKEKDIFVDNRCSSENDVTNLRNYFIAKNPQQKFQNFTQRISNELLGVLIESALVAHELEEKIDYFVVKVKENGKQYSYAAPIINNTKRPDAKVSYSDFVQQLLHTLHNMKKPSLPFKIEPSTETIIANSPKNFFDDYRLNGGPIIGLTGTAGSCVEREEFFKQQGLVAFNYPTFNPDLSQDLGLITAFGSEEHLQKTCEFIQQFKQQNPGQPILLISSSPQATERFRDFLAARSAWKIQSYHGCEEAGKSEENIIYTAGKDFSLTAANESLARGADIDPEHENGLLVINLCTDLTPSELLQIQGRAARNGKPGQYISIIDAQSIGTPSDSAETLAAAFKRHQHNLSLQRQQEREKMRLLEETRFLLVNRILKLRESADKILAPQFGEETSIVDHQQLISALSLLSRRADKHYAELLEKHNAVKGEIAQEFLEDRVSDYQQILDTWLPEHKFKNVQFVEPSIPVGTLSSLSPQLHNVTVEQLCALADIFHRKWKLDGHQQMQQNIAILDEIFEFLDPYFKNECSLKEALGQALDEKGLLKEEFVNAQITMLKTNIAEMLEYAKSLPVIGRVVPVDRIKTFINGYLDATKTQIREKRWNDVSLPNIDVENIRSWFSGISNTLAVGSLIVGGPIPFIVKRFIVPTVFGWIKTVLKRQFAQSESLVAQILIGLDDIGDDLPEAINALIRCMQEDNIKVGLLIDKFAPLANNKALLMTIAKYLELVEMPEYIPLVQAIPDFLPILEAYRDCNPEELLNVETLIAILQHAASSKVVSKALKNSPYLASLQHLSQLNPDFLCNIRALSLPQFFALQKLIAHPNFFVFMEKLPAEITYGQLEQWIAAPEECPVEVKSALDEMLAYQTNRERLAEESKQSLHNVRKEYDLNLEKFTAELEKLKPIVKTREPITAPVEEINSASKVGLKHVAFLAVTIAFIAYGAVFLSPAMAVVCFALAGWLIFPALIKDFPLESRKFKEAEKTEKLLSPTITILDEFILTTSAQSPPAKENAFSKQDQVVPSTRSVVNTKHGFFTAKNLKSLQPHDKISNHEHDCTPIATLT
jgi:hypothetical protein